MGRYLCLVYLDPEKLRALPQEVRNFIVNEVLECSPESTLVTVRHHRLSAAHSPAGPLGPLAGLRFIEARDLNDAIRAAAKMPAVRFGSIEVRPVLETETEEIL